jgi:predicted MPP superfamily phosphohydrolase
VILAGDEQPWFGTAPDLSTAPSPEEAFRILVAHTPDRYPWAQEHGFGLMLAGHNHGGQIRIPLLGPIVSPSRYGVKYASGVFHEPPTTLHVSRGLSALHLLRFNCQPELTKLVLTRGE